jgi:hypothetical protein
LFKDEEKGKNTLNQRDVQLIEESL